MQSQNLCQNQAKDGQDLKPINYMPYDVSTGVPPAHPLQKQEALNYPNVYQQVPVQANTTSENPLQMQL